MTPSSLRSAILQLLKISLAGALLGGLLGHIGLGLAGALLLCLVWHLHQLQRLLHWLNSPYKSQVPEARGLWGEVFDSLHHMRRREHEVRKRMQSVINRIQSSTTALSDAVVMIDRDGHLEWWNQAANTLLGLRSPDDAGQHVTNLIRDPRFVDYFELTHHAREGLDIPSHIDPNVQLMFSLTRYGRGERLMVVRDVTRLHNLEQMRKDFVANVSHELRTPLTVIVGYLETLSDNADAINPRWKRALDQMQQQARRMQALLTDLLLLARLENDELGRDEEVIQLAPLLHSIHQDARDVSGERGHQIKLEIQGGALFKGVEAELRSAFSNLVFNAVKYTQDGGQISIRWWEDVHGGHLSVSDNGAGIAPEHLNRLTERFYRVDASRNSSTGGTGLGLAIVKHVMLRHQGYLSIASTPEKGSTFTCHLPEARLIDTV
ncbi:phosphate regulon sensor histidine kinase PhoR [Halopseudomonas salegens]|uniref:Phosphate regulon sensor protein PhoR n=1 Tax=Halopseudomonas salegens TaxID=1434072 RepID=A0A1H2HS43_9GAMM|nr:phosphate regulon sensor histidine kinase PhoR [Halopseudomonas salegens]SDU34657.1 PAS/PAC sensor signal transduction histidine kinase [Halopseudomonas salegens]